MAIDAEVVLEQRAASRARRFVLPVVLGLAILQALWIVSVPPFRASDEFDHAYRAAAVARGQWWADEAAENGRGILVRVPGDIVTAAHAQCAAMLYTGPDNCNPVPGSEQDGTVLVGSGAGTYNPVFYWVIGTVALPFDGAAALYAMRLASALLCLLFMGLAAWALSLVGRPAWPGAGLLLATSPVFVFSTAVAAPNGLEMASALALWCTLLVLPTVRDRPTVHLLVGAAVASAAVLSTLRLLGPAFVVMTVLLVTLFHGRRAVEFVTGRPRVVATACVPVALATAYALHWTRRMSTVTTTDGPQQGTDQWEPASLLLWPMQTIAAFPYRDLAGPVFVYPVVGGLVIALTVAALRCARGTQRLAVAAAAAAALLLPVAATAITRSDRGVMWQGRYGLPLAVGFVLMAGFALASSERSPRRRLVVPAGVALAASTAGCVVKVVRDELGRPASVGDLSWLTPPYLVIVAASALAWLALAQATRAPDQVPESTHG